MILFPEILDVVHAKYLPMQVEICEEEASANTPEVSSFCLLTCHCGSLLASLSLSWICIPATT